MTLSLTVFENIFDNKTSKKMTFEDWDELEKFFYKLFEISISKPAKGEKIQKHHAKLISPASYKPNSKRRNVNVLRWDWACIDVDEFDGTFEDIEKTFKGCKYLCYSTGSSTKENPKFRLVFPLTRSIKAEEIRHFWYALNKDMLGQADKQTKDLSRLFYVPGQYKGAYNFMFTHEEEVLDPDDLMERHPYKDPYESNTLFDKLPEDVKEKYLQRQRDQLGKNYTWSSYQDCPFVNQKLVDEYRSISSSGWYHQMYRIMVSTASSAIRKGYNITPDEIAMLCHELDSETGGWYKDRNLKLEAKRAIAFALKSSVSGSF